MNKIIRYDLIGAYKAGVTIHPQLDIESKGCKVINYEGVPIGDCAIIEVDRLPEPLPEYVTKVESYKF